MSASTVPQGADQTIGESPARFDTRTDWLDATLGVLASLKLTVVLLALGIFVVLVGTLAQVEEDIWQVVPKYFRSWIMWVDINLFFPPSFFPAWKQVAFPEIPFPGGMAVGIAMMVNLITAHVWRFTFSYRGRRTWIGLGVVAAGVILTSLVIVWGHNHEGFQAQAPLSWSVLWTGFKFCLLLTWMAGGLAIWQVGILPLRQQTKAATSTHVALLTLSIAAFAGLTVANYYFVMEGSYPGDDAVRILWQLLQGTLVGLILLIGCYLLFDRRAGVVLLHAGIMLMMGNELLVARFAAEYQISLQEGQTTDFMRDIRTIELAFIDRSDPEQDRQVVIPASLLLANAAANENRIVADQSPLPVPDPDDQLPVSVCVLSVLKNHEIKPRAAEDDNPATQGRGLKETAIAIPASTGTDSSGGVDFAAAYVKLLDKKSGQDLGTYLLSQLAAERDNPFDAADSISVTDANYNILLRFKRAYLPYTVSLKDVRKDDYLASDTPRNYSSDIYLHDESRGVDEDVHIKMNNPLRYAGLTFYQSGYNRIPIGGRVIETTSLAVVRNDGWMIPYVACAIVAVAMLFHFMLTLRRFVSRRTREDQKASIAFHRTTLIASTVTAMIVIAYVAPKLVVPREKNDSFNLYTFGQLPVAHKGRVKPIDTLARNTLRQLSQRETVRMDGNQISAVEWFLAVISDAPGSADYPIVRIENEEVLRVFGLERREGFRYSLTELQPGMGEFIKQIDASAQLKSEELTLKQSKLRELYQRLEAYMTIRRAFTPPPLPPMPTVEQVKADPTANQQWLMTAGLLMNDYSERLNEMQPPLAMPQVNPDGSHGWQTLADAHWQAALLMLEDKSAASDSPVLHFESLLRAFAAKEPVAFNTTLRRYNRSLQAMSPEDYSSSKQTLETWFNHVSPFYLGNTLYVVAFILAMLGWLIPSRAMNWSSFTLIALTFLLHTVALGLRVYLSGRPPVTNLYSSAVFIGWGCVLFGLVLEGLYRNGLGNLTASVSGFATLLIAYFLGAGGDTIEVLQAVLDTQFWLATHVVCITLGYTTTYVAGLLGVIFVLFGLITPRIGQTSRRELARMIYGVTCFSIFFSFVGTVLGGLWADDSWGRFWGWDPKENGALMIVLWNALVLHARWDKLVGDRGLALLAIGGNIITSWSWFGVNQLGVGLHSYGFTNGVVLALGIFALSQLLLIAAGLLPKSLWWSYRAHPEHSLKQEQPVLE